VTRDPREAFRRLRPRAAADDEGAGQRLASATVRDADGKRALFSDADSSSTFGSVTVACSSCGERTVVSLPRALRLAVPSLHLPCLRPAPWSLMRCPACWRLTWVELSVRL
jgi:hypothetical protein